LPQSSRATRFDSLFVVAEVPRSLRLRFDDIRLAKWLVPALRCIALPVADRRNRFFVPLCVFIFGIRHPSSNKKIAVVASLSKGKRGETE
jgi:hypothetical protein